METVSEKVRENRLRRMASRQGYRVLKSRRRDDRAYDYGGYMIIDANTNFVVWGSHPLAFCLSLGDVEDWLTLPDDQREQINQPAKPEAKSKPVANVVKLQQRKHRTNGNNRRVRQKAGRSR